MPTPAPAQPALFYVREDDGAELIGPFATRQDADTWAGCNPFYYGKHFAKRDVVWWQIASIAEER